MKLIQAEQTLLKLKQPVVTTQDVSAALGIDLAHASKILSRVSELGRVFRLMRGKWALEKVDPLILPEYLTTPFPSYISLQTALFFHGIISQIPSNIYAVSLARTQKYSTSFGVISVHHVQPDFFFGYELINNIKIATPEKALIDILYLSPAKTRLFKSLPELDLSNFNQKAAEAIIKKIESKRIKKIIMNRLEPISCKK